MSRLYGAAVKPVLAHSASLGVSASVSGSAISMGYSRLVGMYWSAASAAAGAASGMTIWQSADQGTTWSLLSASQAVTAGAASPFAATIYGNAVKVHVWNGATAASAVKAHFVLYPI